MRSLFKLTWTETKLFVRDPVTVVFTLALPIIFLLVMGGVFGNTPSPGFYRGVGAMNYYMPSYFGLVIMAIGTVALPVHIAGYRERGVLRRFRASSFSIWPTGSSTPPARTSRRSAAGSMGSTTASCVPFTWRCRRCRGPPSPP